VAVFPDRIVLKNSTDSQAVIEAAIGTGGADAITQGEIVLGINPASVQFYTKAGDGSIVTLGGTSVSVLGDLTDVDLSTPATDEQALLYNSTSGNWEPGDVALDSTIIAGDLLYNDGTGIVRLPRGGNGQVLKASSTSIGWSEAAAITILSAIAPSTRSDGSSILNGDQWYDTAQGLLYVRVANAWVEVSGGSVVGSIDDLSDVDTSTNPPTQDQVLIWDGTNWVPGDQTGGGGGGGSIAGTVLQKSETQTAASGAATFVELGASGILVDITSSLDAWIVLYPTAADRTADAARAYGDDPAPGVGVLAESYVTAGGTVLASPGTTYFNNDDPDADALYVAVRDQAGANVDSQVTIKAYVHQNFGGTGTNRVTDSGTAASGALTLTGMGQSGQFCTVTSSLDAWVVFYGSAADRTADNARSFGTDPAPGSGVQAEFYIAAGTTVLATPGAMYFNNDTSPTDAMYLAVRDQAGASVDSLITVKVYAETSYTGISGGTFGSG